jgi:membrane protease YdiL (CAAX protease family)
MFGPWGGIALSSLIFGAMHIPNTWGMEPEQRRPYYTVVLPLLTASGIYDGWLTYKNCSLKESVALHVWYDFIILGLSTLASEKAFTKPTNFSIAFSF